MDNRKGCTVRGDLQACKAVCERSGCSIVDESWGVAARMEDLRVQLAKAQAENERLREENDEARELIASAAPLAWLHTNQACRDYGEALNFATEWEKRGLAFVQLGESDFRSLKSKHEETLRELAALRARDDGRVKRAQESVSKFLLEYGFIQLSADVVWCAVMAHDVLTAADGVKQ